jgi:hypothetical protein
MDTDITLGSGATDGRWRGGRATSRSSTTGGETMAKSPKLREAVKRRLIEFRVLEDVYRNTSRFNPHAQGPHRPSGEANVCDRQARVAPKFVHIGKGESKRHVLSGESCRLGFFDLAAERDGRRRAARSEGWTLHRVARNQRSPLT